MENQVKEQALQEESMKVFGPFVVSLHRFLLESFLHSLSATLGSRIYSYSTRTL